MLKKVSFFLCLKLRQKFFKHDNMFLGQSSSSLHAKLHVHVEGI